MRKEFDDFPPEALNVQFLESIDQDSLATWLLTDRKLPYINYRISVSGASDMADYYRIAPDYIREKIDKATCTAISRWNPKMNSTEDLVELSMLAALTKMEEPVPLLVRIIDDGKIRPSKNKEKENDFATVISCIAGSETGEAKEAVERWFKSEKFDYHCSANLCVGLAHYYPDRIAEFLPKLFADIEKEPEYFLPELIVSCLCNETGPDRLEEALKKFEGKVAEQMLAGMPVAREIFEEVMKEEEQKYQILSGN